MPAQTRLRGIKREKAIVPIGEGVYEDLFDSLDGEEFEKQV